MFLQQIPIYLSCYYAASFNEGGGGVIVSHYTLTWAKSFILKTKRHTCMAPFRLFSTKPHHYTYKLPSDLMNATWMRQTRDPGKATICRNFHNCLPNMSSWWVISRCLFDSHVCTNQTCLLK